MLQRSSRTTGHILRSPNHLQTCVDLGSDQKATTLLRAGKQTVQGEQRKQFIQNWCQICSLWWHLWEAEPYSNIPSAGDLKVSRLKYSQLYKQLNWSRFRNAKLAMLQAQSLWVILKTLLKLPSWNLQDINRASSHPPRTFNIKRSSKKERDFLTSPPSTCSPFPLPPASAFPALLAKRFKLPR